MNVWGIRVNALDAELILTVFNNLIDYILAEVVIYSSIRKQLGGHSTWFIHKRAKSTDVFQSPVWLRLLALLVLSAQSVCNIVLFPFGLELNNYYTNLLEYGMRRRVYLLKKNRA